MYTKIFLVGNPNVGKTLVFNALTGKNQKTGNFSGTTIASKSGVWNVSKSASIEIIDLAGTYSQKGKKQEERLAWESIEKSMREDDALFIQVVNPEFLQQSLALTLDLQQKGINPLLFLNTRENEVSFSEQDCQILAEKLHTPVFNINAKSDFFLSNFTKELEPFLQKLNPIEAPPLRSFRSILEKQSIIKPITDSLSRGSSVKNSSKESWIDKILLSPFLGVVSFLAMMWAVFEITFTIGSIPMDFIDAGFSFLIESLFALFGEGFLQSLLFDGALAGVGATVIFLPNIITLFFFLALFKESGYLARTSFLFDKIFRKVGTSGKASVHLLMGFGCNVPSIMAVKQFESKKEKIIVSLMTTFMSCGARLPVYTLLISAFIPQGFQGITLWALYIFGIIIALGTGGLVSRAYKAHIKPKSIIYQMPELHIPSFKESVLFAFTQGKLFLLRVGKFIVPASMIIWILFTFPSDRVEKIGVEGSYGATIAKTISPVFEPIGFDWRITAGIISGIAAKEVMVATFAEIFESPDDEDEGVIGKTLQDSGVFSLGVALSLLFFTLLYTPCMAVLGVMKEELGWRWTVFGAVYPMLVGWIVGFVLFRLFG